MFYFFYLRSFEWGAKFHHGVYPKGPALQNMSEGEVMYFGLYFVMTGLHGIHVVIGACLILWVTINTAKGKFSSEYYTPVEGVGLFWHIVDLIWIYLFPLLYLVG